MKKDKKRNYKKMQKQIEENPGVNMLISGDFNARTEGGTGKKGERERRECRDSCMNAEGKKLIKWLNENGLEILNGTVDGDEKEDDICIGTWGDSVIDYIKRNGIIKKEEEDMEIIESTESDHMKLFVK